MPKNEDLKTTIEQLLDTQAAAWVLSEKLKRMQQLSATTNTDVSNSLSQVEQILANLDIAKRELEIKLPEYVFDAGVQWAASQLGMSLVDIFPTHLDRMLVHEDEGIRNVAVRCGDLTAEQLQKALNDPSSWVSEVAYQRAQNGNKPMPQDQQHVSLESAVCVSYRG